MLGGLIKLCLTLPHLLILYAYGFLAGVVVFLAEFAIVFNKTFSTPGLHTIKVVVAGTRGRPRVDVDAFLLAY